MPVIRLGSFIPGPVGGLGIGKDNARVFILFCGVRPDIHVALTRSGRGHSCSFEPWMLIAGVIDHQLDHHLHAAQMCGIKKCFEVVQCSIRRVDIVVVRDIVAVIAQRRREERQQPDAGYAQVIQIIQLRQQSRKIADAIVVGIGKCTNVKFVDNRIFVPEGIGCAGDLLHAFTLRKALTDTSSLHAAHAQDVRRLNSRPQCNIVSIAPDVLRAAQQVIHQKTFMRGASDLIEIEMGPAALLVK